MSFTLKGFNSGKRGSMALSMNAIVVIILAMAMLGVGIFIVNKIRGEAAGVIDIETPSLKSPADATNPVVLGQEEFEVKQGESKSVRVSVFNTEASQATGVYLKIVNCRPTGQEATLFNSGGAGSNLLQNMVIPQRSEQTYRIEITGTNTADTYMCTLEAGNAATTSVYGTADMMVKVV